MKSKFLFFVLTFLLLFSILKAQDEYANASLSGATSFDDFADITLYASGSAGYYWFCTAYFFTEWYNGSTWVQENIYPELEDWSYSGYWTEWNITNKPYQVKNIADRGNGTFRVRFSVNVNWASDEDIHQFTVTDNTAPSAPIQNDIVEPFLGHPQLTWNKPTIDTEKYKVYRTGTDYDHGTWNHIGTPTTTSFEDEDVTCGIPDATVSYKIKAVDYEDNVSAYSNTESIVAHFKPVVYHGPIKTLSYEIPKSYSLSQNFPNPFNPETNITFGIPEDCFANLVIYNINGEKVATLVNDQLSAGTYTAKFDGSVLPSGVYIYRINAGSYSEIKRMLLIK